VDKSDYYAVLDSQPTATIDDLRAAYKRLAFQHHPDHSQDPQATQHMQLLNEAYEVLSNPEKKARYDQERLTLNIDPAVEKPLAPETVTQESPAVRRRQRREHERWLRNQLKVIARVTFMVTILFFWTLFTGEVNVVLILTPVLVVIYLIAEIVLKIRRPA
jgi:curved DNA-binding protein CbpA